MARRRATMALTLAAAHRRHQRLADDRDWAAVLSLSLQDPIVVESSVVGHPVSLVTDGSAPDTPPLHMFAAGDVLWMVATTDQAVVEGARLRSEPTAVNQGAPSRQLDLAVCIVSANGARFEGHEYGGIGKPADGWRRFATLERR